MSSRSAVVLVILLVALIAFCFAGVFAAMTGSYHLNFGNNTNQTHIFGNHTNHSNSHSGGSVQTHSDSRSSSSDVETKEDTNPEPTPDPAPTPSPSPSPVNNTVKRISELSIKNQVIFQYQKALYQLLN
jgi:cytoskeletal protein RodZ